MDRSTEIKILGIANDPLRRIAQVQFCGVLDELPQIQATIRLTSSASQTQAEIHAALKQQLRAVLEEAIRGLDRLSE